MEVPAALFDRRCGLPQDGRASHAYLHALIENNPVAVLVLDSRHRVQMCNAAFSRLFQYAPTDLHAGSIDSLIAGPDCLQEAAEATQAVLAGKRVHLVSRRRRRDGVSIAVEIYGIPLVLDGRVDGVYGLYQDVTNRTLLRNAPQSTPQELPDHGNAYADTLADCAKQFEGSSRRQPAQAAATTLRETEIIKLLAVGLSSKEVAMRLSMGTRTVETHRLNIYRKLRLRNIADLVLFAVRNGMIPLGESSTSARQVPYSEEQASAGA